MAIIELENLTKTFGDVTAINGIDLEIAEGEVFGFLGPNGAGKSTTINIMLDFMRPTSGSVAVFGYDSRKGSLAIRQRSGFLADGYDLYDRLSARRHLEFAVETKGAGTDIDDLLERVGLADAADRKVGGYSKGMQQRLALANALIGDPDLIILDEPHSGLDPNGARRMLDIIAEENERGTTVFFSSHILGHVEAICDRVAILNEGEIVTTDTVEGLHESVEVRGEISLILDEVTDDIVAAVRGIVGVHDVEVDGTTLTVTCADNARATVVDEVLEQHALVHNVETTEPSLDELFAAYTKAAEDGATLEINGPAEQTATGGGGSR